MAAATPADHAADNSGEQLGEPRAPSGAAMRLLLEAEVVGHAVFEPDVGEATLSMPERNIELRLKNLDVDMGIEKPLLEALLIFEDENLEAGFESGRTLLKDLLSSLSYVTSFKFEYYRSKRLIDWSDGDFARQYYAISSFPGHDLPEYVLTAELLKSAGIVWQVSKDHPLEAAVHWFASGVRETASEAKFELFWFAMELLASYGKDTAPVNDLCAVCQTPLYCETCETHPKHRPYQKQAIEQLIHGIVGEKAHHISKRLFDVRNLLMHGATKDQIESKIEGKMEECVEHVAQITKGSILNLLGPDIAKISESDQFEMIFLDGYARMVMGARMLMTSSKIPPDVTMLNRLAMPEINLQYRRDPKTEH